MPLDKRSIQKILGITEDSPLDIESMAKIITITYFPYEEKSISDEILEFNNEFKKILLQKGVEIIPYEEALVEIPFKKMIQMFLKGLLAIIFKPFISKKNTVLVTPNLAVLLKIFKRKKIKKGVTIIALGENKAGSLPMDFVMSFRNNSIVTIVDSPPGIDSKTEFAEHFDTAMKLFVHNMSHIIVGVNKKNLLFYNLNAAHPVFDNKKVNYEKVVEMLIPKIAAPIKPLRFTDLHIHQENFDINDKKYKEGIEDLVKAGSMFKEIGLYPPGKSVNELPFRNSFYKWAVKIHLDNRTGMSYGFLAKQLPTSAPNVRNFEELLDSEKEKFKDKGVFFDEDKFFATLSLPEGKFLIEIPEVWVLSQRSGSDKTNFDPQKDLVIMGLSKGEVIVKIQRGVKLTSGYRPSYDTQVILAHAIGNAIISGISNHLGVNSSFVKNLENHGIGIAHWHGYINKMNIPEKWHIHGIDNPHVSCSTPQSAHYALSGKLETFKQALKDKIEFEGDIHVEPHHGTNINFPSFEQVSKIFFR